MNSLDGQYTDLLQDILDNGVTKSDRTGTGTLSVFGRTIRHKMSEGFPLLTTKKVPFRLIATELMWFLRGDTNIKFLVDNNCHIWDGDAYKNYDKFCIDAKWMEPVKKELNGEVYDMGRKYDKDVFTNRIKTDDEFAKRWGNLGPVYGKQWRSWRKNRWDKIDMDNHIEYVDQIQTLINDLKTNPDSRRLMVNSWNVGELDQMILPPCHYGFQVYTRELLFDERWDLFSDKPYDGNARGKVNTLDYLDDKNIPTRAISLMFNMRSSDVPLGLPFNIASYGLLLEIIAKEVNMVPDELISNLGDCHIYLNQIDGVKEQIGREPFELPRLNIQSEIGIYDFFEYLNVAEPSHFVIENYQSHPHIKIPLSN